MSEIETKVKRPMPMRPATGLLAWQATLGYISSRLSPDAMLQIRAHSKEARVVWSASVSWGRKEEMIHDQPSLAAALRLLWDEVRHNHRIFDRVEDAVRSPQGYDDAEWLDLATQESLQRLVWVTQSVFPGRWRLVLIYQPVDTPALRLLARLTTSDNEIAVGGRGASLLEACRALFRNATPVYAGNTQLKG